MIDFTVETKDRNVVLYLRLSRDDRNKGLSVSIENQDKMLTRFAKENCYEITERYIDDGESGYSFQRPDFDRLNKDIVSGKVKRLLIKDMSRLGRHNARALLFMEDARDYGCEVIALDDGYSNFQDNDSTIGIKTWHNELYVKEVSKKVKNIIHMKQEDGEWMTTPPFGYRKVNKKSTQLVIEPDNACVVKRIFQMYADGYGILQIARTLTRENVSTPSRSLHEFRLANGTDDKSRYTDVWNNASVRRILKNETYLGTLILHKGECVKIRGKYQKLSKEKWKVFKHHHEAIIDEKLFRICQEKLESRKVRSKRKRKHNENMFHGLLYCADCDSLLKPYRTVKDIREGNTHYYCSTYLKQGKTVCSAKSITEQQLRKAVTIFLKRCRDVYKDFLEQQHVHANTKEAGRKRISKTITHSKTRITQLKLEIKQLIENKMHESMAQPENYAVIQESYQSLIDEKAKMMKECEENIEVLKQELKSYSLNEEHLTTALHVLDEMIAKQDYSKKELQILFRKILVHDHQIVFYFKGYFSDKIDANVMLADEEQEAYCKAIIEEIEKQVVDQMFSLKSVHQALCNQGYTYSYKGTFMTQVKRLEAEGVIRRPHKNKKAIYQKVE